MGGGLFALCLGSCLVSLAFTEFITEWYKDSSPAAYPHLQSNALDDIQHDMSAVLHQTLSHPSLHPHNLSILPGKKAWLLNLDLIVLADAGNVYDALFMAARAALWDTKVPRTRSVEYKAMRRNLRKSAVEGDIEVEMDIEQSGFHTRQPQAATDFELLDYWDEGAVLCGRERWPLCVTLNVVRELVLLPGLDVSSAVFRYLPCIISTRHSRRSCLHPSVLSCYSLFLPPCLQLCKR